MEKQQDSVKFISGRIRVEMFQFTNPTLRVRYENLTEEEIASYLVEITEIVGKRAYKLSNKAILIFIEMVIAQNIDNITYFYIKLPVTCSLSTLRIIVEEIRNL